MALFSFITATVAAILLTSQGAFGQGTAGGAAGGGQQDCQTAAQNLMKTCSEGGQIQFPNFLWFVTNGTSQNGEAPADEASFKTQMCGAEPMIGGCIFTQLGQLANSSCAGQIPVLQAIQGFLFTYDLKCAHPCRKSLIPDLRACYTSNGLSVDLFLSNRSAGHVIGSTQPEVTGFCDKRAALLGCMKPVHAACPEAEPILAQADFHLPSYEKGVTILCSHPAVYLKGLQCFEEPTPQVEACVTRSQQAFLQTQVEARSKNWTQVQFVQASCKVTIEQADCDLTAWSNKNHEACTDAVVGLRREMECSLLPPNCTTAQPQLFKAACNSNRFNHGARGGSGGSGASGIASLSAALLFLLGLLSPAAVRV